MDQRERIGKIIREYDSQGWHRTGTDADRVSARWLGQQVVERGLEPALEPVSLSRIVPGPCYVEVGDCRVNGLPLFAGGFPGPGGGPVSRAHRIAPHAGPLLSMAALGPGCLGSPSERIGGPTVLTRHDGVASRLMV